MDPSPYTPLGFASLRVGRLPSRPPGRIAALWFALLLPAAAVAQPSRDFDHFRTGFPLTGAHERVECETCHVGAIFKGTPTSCGTCHAKGGTRAVTSKPPRHVPTTSDCGDCHVTASWANARFDHMAVQGSCASCHNGGSATGKPSGHVPSSNACEACHRTLAWVPARFDHAGVTGSCFSCHNGATATGKPANHIPSSNACETCHGTSSWRTSGFDHASVTGSCASCHNGVAATGKPANHVPSTNACETCHGTSAWVPAGFDHAGVTGSCASCHNGTQATGKSSGHFATTVDCGECHETARWTPIRFRHSSPSYPGDHAAAPACGSCHPGNTQTASWPFASFRPDCAGCHAGDFKPDPHRKVESPRVLYTAGELRDCTGACHTYTDATLTTTQKARSGHHSVSRRGW